VHADAHATDGRHLMSFEEIRKGLDSIFQFSASYPRNSNSFVHMMDQSASQVLIDLYQEASSRLRPSVSLTPSISPEEVSSQKRKSKPGALISSPNISM
jgi:hypothetical protein